MAGRAGLRGGRKERPDGRPSGLDGLFTAVAFSASFPFHPRQAFHTTVKSAGREPCLWLCDRGLWFLAGCVLQATHSSLPYGCANSASSHQESLDS